MTPWPHDFLGDTRAPRATRALFAVLGRSPRRRRARSSACGPPSLDPGRQKPENNRNGPPAPRFSARSSGSRGCRRALTGSAPIPAPKPGAILSPRPALSASEDVSTPCLIPGASDPQEKSTGAAEHSPGAGCVPAARRPLPALSGSGSAARCPHDLGVFGAGGGAAVYRYQDAISEGTADVSFQGVFNGGRWGAPVLCAVVLAALTGECLQTGLKKQPLCAFSQAMGHGKVPPEGGHPTP